MKKLRPTIVMTNFLLSVCLASLIFYLFQAPAVGASELKAELVNTTEEGTLAALPTGQVQLTYPDSRTKLLKYRSHLQPVVADGKVYIFTTKDAKVTGIVVYDAASGQGQSFPLPDDLKLNFTSYLGTFFQPGFSPDGTKVAYYFIDGKSKHKPKFGFVDLTGKVVVPPRFDWAGGFSEGMAPVGVGEYGKRKWGYIDRTGKIAIQPQFVEASGFSEGVAGVRFASKQGSLDKTGKRIIPQHLDPANKCGFIDQKGKIVIPPQFDRVGKFSEGLALVTINNKSGFIDKLGFIDKTGKMVILLNISGGGGANDFTAGLARVRIDNKDGFIDRKGNIVISPRFDSARDFFDGVAWVEADKKWTIIDKEGKVTIPPPVEHDHEFHDFSEGLAAVQAGKKWGFIDKTGKFVIPPQYHYARSFAEGLARVNVDVGGKWGYGKWGYIDRTGKMIIPAQYDHALSFSEGLAGVLIDGKYGFIDQTGKMIIPPQYDYVLGFSQGLVAVSVGDMEEVLGGVRVRSWPAWRLLWQSPLCPLAATDVPPRPPLWESKSQAEFYPLFFDPPRFLKYQVPEPGKSEKAKAGKSK